MLSQGIGVEPATVGATIGEKAVASSSPSEQGRHARGASGGRMTAGAQRLGGESHSQTHTHLKAKPFSNWRKMRKMPLSPTLSPQKKSGQEAGRELAPASVTLFCCRTQGLAEDAACQTRTEFCLFISSPWGVGGREALLISPFHFLVLETGLR